MDSDVDHVIELQDANKKQVFLFITFEGPFQQENLINPYL